MEYIVVSFLIIAFSFMQTSFLAKVAEIIVNTIYQEHDFETDFLENQSDMENI